MDNTIDLLEAVGREASLRHASAGALATLLEHIRVSDALASAVASSDSSLLTGELGSKVMCAPQVVQTFYGEH